MKLSASHRASLQASAELYHQSIDEESLDYLGERGLGDRSTVDRFLLGRVVEPAKGHEAYAGRLCIPYLTPAGAVALRFRCIKHAKCEGHPKYLDVSGQGTYLYNVAALREAADVIYLTEGEIDAISASVVGFPAVGVSGAEKWQEHWSRNLEDYEQVVVLADGDDPGKRFAEMVREKVEQARVIQLPAGHDTNSFLVEYGVSAFKDLL